MLNTDPDTQDAPLNVFGKPLQSCSMQPLTGFYRDGHCTTGSSDAGRHVVCANVTQPFLEYSQAQGNDLTTPRPEHGFPGLKPGDAWCLCAARWLEAYEAGAAPPVNLASTHAKALEVIPRNILMAYAMN